MRSVSVEQVIEAVKQLCMEANYDLEDDVDRDQD